MVFDPRTARPVKIMKALPVKFDPSTARPVKDVPIKAERPYANIPQAALAGTIGGGASTLQLLENAAKLQERFSPLRVLSRQPVSTEPGFFGRQAQQAREFIGSQGDFEKTGIPERRNISTKVVEGLSQAPSRVAQVVGLGGGIPGLAAVGALEGVPAGAKEAAKQAAINAGLGVALGGISRIRPSAASISRVTPAATTAARSGLSAGLFATPEILSNAPVEDIASSGLQGALLGIPKAPVSSRQRNLAETKLREKRLKIGSEILQPPKRQLSKAIKQGVDLKSVEKFTENIGKAKNAEDAISQTQELLGNIANERNDILKKNNFDVGTNYLKPLRNLLDKVTNPASQFTDSQINAVKQVYSKAIDYRRLVKGKLDRVTAQSLKEDLQKAEQPLFVKEQAKTINVESESPRLMALRALRQGLKEAVEGGDRRVKELNETYGGLQEATSLLSNIAAQARNTPAEGLIHRFVPFFLSGFFGKAGAARKEISKKQRSFPGRVSKILKIREKEKNLKTLPVKALLEPGILANIPLNKERSQNNK